MCIYITNNLCKWGLGTPGEQCSTDLKWGRASFQHMNYQLQNYTNGKHFDKYMEFCILVVHDLMVRNGLSRRKHRLNRSLDDLLRIAKNNGRHELLHALSSIPVSRLKPILDEANRRSLRHSD